MTPRELRREMSRRKLMVLIHPTTPCDAPQNDPGTFLSVGYPGETAMAATKLALSGVLEEYPDVKIVWSHLGGSLAMILDRIDRGYQRFSRFRHRRAPRAQRRESHSCRAGSSIMVGCRARCRLQRHHSKFARVMRFRLEENIYDGLPVR